MIRLDQLSKTFRGRQALDSLSLEIGTGEIFGLLGHNGAGKSTTFGMLLGQVHPTSGEAFVRGVSVQREREKALRGVGAIFETPAFYDYMSGWQNLRILTSYSARLSASELKEAVQFVGLEKRIHDPVRVYSHGMRQRLALAQALLPKPDLVLLDEPAEGLDPEGIHEMRQLILRLNREHGMTVVFSSHLLAEVEQLCDRIAILNQGRLIFQGRWSDLAVAEPGHRLELDDWQKAEAVLQQLDVRKLSENIVVLPKGGDMADLVAALVTAGIRVRVVEPVRQTLEEIYLRMIATS
jgi:ABC-2 type transport system ATP-binding protein